MTKTDIGIYRGLKEKFDPEVHIGFFITTDTGELLLGDQSLGQTITGWTMEDGLLTLQLNTGADIQVTFPEASETAKGLLSAADKKQLNDLVANLNSKVDKVTGKSLVADSEIAKLGGLPNSTELTNSIANAKAAGDNAQSDLNAHKQNKSNPHEVTKDQVGLGNVTNDALVKRSEMGVANGVATLDENGKVPATQLPSYVDDIVDVYATYTKSATGVLSNITLYSDSAKTKLVTGEAGKIYQNVADGEPNYLFRWTGTVFSQTGASSLIIGEVAGTAYDGAKGKANADNIAKIKGTSLTHIKDDAPVTTTADKVSLNYECYEGTQYGSTGTAHTADIPAATTEKAGVMSASDKVEVDKIKDKIDTIDVQNALEGKADKLELSNVLAETIPGSPLLEELSTTTLEDLGKHAFIKMWNTRCGNTYSANKGKYDASKDVFMLHNHEWTYEEALLIYTTSFNCQSSNSSIFTGSIKAKTFFWDFTALNYQTTYNWNYAFYNNLSIVVIPAYWSTNSVSYKGTFYLCKKLKEILGMLSTSTTPLEFYNCTELETLQTYIGMDQVVDLRYSPKLTYQTVYNCVTVHRTDYLKPTESNPGKLILHADIFNKILDETELDWHGLIELSNQHHIILATT